MAKNFKSLVGTMDDSDMINHKHSKTLLDGASDETHVIRWRCGINDKTKYNAGFSVVADFSLTNGSCEVFLDFDIDSMTLEIPGGIGSSSAYDVVMERADVIERELNEFIAHLRACADEMRLKNEVLQL